MALPPELAGNNADLELGWAIQAYDHAETYYNLLTSVEPSYLRLSMVDDKIYKTFRTQFSDLGLGLLNKEELKTNAEKAKWRSFCNDMKEEVDDYNFGTLIRLNAELDYSENNTILVPRAQFLAIEIARNREGINSKIPKAKKLKTHTKNMEDAKS